MGRTKLQQVERSWSRYLSEPVFVISFIAAAFSVDPITLVAVGSTRHRFRKVSLQAAPLAMAASRAALSATPASSTNVDGVYSLAGSIF